MLDIPGLQKALRSWIEKGVHGETLRVVRLMHHGSADPVDYWPPSERSIPELAQLIWERGHSDAGGYGEPQTYAVEALCGENTRPSARVTFEAIPELAYEDGRQGKNEPTARGALAIMQRHTIDLHRSTLLAHGGLQRDYRDALNDARTEIKELRAENKELRNAKRTEELEAHQRKMDLETLERRTKMQRELLDKVLMFVPFVVNRVAGARVLPETNPSAEIVKSLAGSLKKNPNLEKITELLTPTEALQFIELMRASEALEQAAAGKPPEPERPLNGVPVPRAIQ